jgi:hypothetical protein
LIVAIHAIVESRPPILNSFPPREKEEQENSSFVENKLNYIVNLARDLRKI